MNIVFIGGVDHGKSTLIGRILLDTGSLHPKKLKEIKEISKELGKETEIAYITDQLKEEREENRTIDTTQIFFNFHRQKYLIVDTPGHEEFIKNMITGATYADTGLLIIDAKKGVEGQTKRHAFILGMIGIKHIIVCFNKMDMIDYDQNIFKSLKQKTLELLHQLEIYPRFCIPVSATKGINILKRSKAMPWYKSQSLLKAVEQIKKEKGRKKKEYLRLPVQDIYKQNNQKIIVGKIISGSLKKGEEIYFLPKRCKTRVKEIKIFGKKKKIACKNENIGIIIGKYTFLVNRGDIITSVNNTPDIVNQFCCNLFWLSKEPLKLNQQITVRSSTQKANGIVVNITNRIDTSSLELITKQQIF